MNYILFFMVIIIGVCVYFLFGYDLSQQWFKGHADLVTILLAIVSILVAVLLALRKRKAKPLAKQSNTLKNVKISGKENKIEVNQHIEKK